MGWNQGGVGEGPGVEVEAEERAVSSINRLMLMEGWPGLQYMPQEYLKLKLLRHVFTLLHRVGEGGCLLEW